MNTLQNFNKRAVRKANRWFFGNGSENSIQQLLADPRVMFFKQALNYSNYEKVPGDILEFGVFTGRTLAALSFLNEAETAWKFMDRKVAGFDWYQGLKGITEQHERWSDESCAINHEPGNPVAPVGTPVTPELVYKLFRFYGLKEPNLETGRYEDVLPEVIGRKYTSAAVVHVDCDLYESTLTVLKGIEPILQDGTMLMFDDWFHYKANPRKGEARALSEWLEAMKGKWTAVHYRQYATFSNAFILSKSSP